MEAIFEDRGSMLGFPPVLSDPARCLNVRVGRDHYVRADTCDYSINPRFIGRSMSTPGEFR